jgi:hypothetical protein
MSCTRYINERCQLQRCTIHHLRGVGVGGSSEELQLIYDVRRTGFLLIRFIPVPNEKDERYTGTRCNRTLIFHNF